LPSQKAWELEYYPYEHPWCGRTFQIKGEWWDFEAEPNACCLEHCDKDPYLCEIAEKHCSNED